MTTWRATFLRWGPPVLWMAVIFAASATPSMDLPSFGSWDSIVKKAGHAVAYGLLALLFRRALAGRQARIVPAWGLAVGYALLDELHQSLVPGRHPSIVDALGFDGGGAAIALTGSVVLARIKARYPARQGAD